MTLRNISCVALLLSANAIAANDSFNTELNVSYGHAGNSDSMSFFGTYFFSQIDTARGPLAAAAFLDPTSNIGVSFNKSDSDIIGTSGTVDADSYGLSGTYVTEDQRFFVSGAITRLESTISRLSNASQRSMSRSVNGYALTGGMYLQPDWSVSASAFFVDSDGTEFQGYSIDTTKLYSFSGERYLQLLGSATFNKDSANAFSFGAEYFFNRRVSISATHNWMNNLSNVDEGFVSLSASWFINPNLALQANSGFNVSGDNEDNFGLSVTGRF